MLGVLKLHAPRGVRNPWKGRADGASLLDELDPGAVAGGGGERSVPSDKRRGEDLGQGQVRRIVGRDVMAELPDPGEEQGVGVAAERQVGEVFEGLQGSLRAEL